MRNFKIIIQYEGTRYQGWQRQDTTNNTIQGKLEAILSKMADTPVQVDGSGRTDAGVHAYGQTANFKLNTQQSAAQIMEYLNCYLPEDIAVVSIEEVPERFHSRLHAKGKIYRYRIWNSSLPCVFDRRYVYEVPETLDVAAMREAAALLIGTHDFKSFTSNKKGKKSTVRTIHEITIEEVEAATRMSGALIGSSQEAGKISVQGRELIITYRGDGFLYHMIRILTGTLIEVGCGKRRPEEMTELLAAGNRELAGMLVPAKGLALMQVFYEIQ